MTSTNNTPYAVIRMTGEDGQPLAAAATLAMMCAMLSDPQVIAAYGWDVGHLRDVRLAVFNGEEVAVAKCGDCGHCSRANTAGNGPGATCGFNLLVAGTPGASIEWTTAAELQPAAIEELDDENEERQT